MKNDVLVCKINPRINRVWVVSDESDYQSIASSEWIVVRNAQYNPYFLAWYFRTPMFQQLMTSEVTGIGGSLTRAQPKRVAEYPVPVLSRERQDKIVSILNRLESIKRERKSELDLLDSLVKARFVELFGNPGINDKKWPVRKMLDIGYFKNGMNFHNDESGISINCLGVGDFKDNSVIEKVSSLPLISLNKMPADDYLLKDGDIVFVRSNGNKSLVGRSIAVYPGDISTTFSGFCIRYRITNHNIIVSYLLSLLKTDSIRRKIIGQGANIQNLNQKILGELVIPIPPLSIQEDFTNFVIQVEKSKIAIDSCIIIIEKALQSRYHYVWGICHDQF